MASARFLYVFLENAPIVADGGSEPGDFVIFPSGIMRNIPPRTVDGHVRVSIALHMIQVSDTVFPHCVN